MAKGIQMCRPSNSCIADALRSRLARFFDATDEDEGHYYSLGLLRARIETDISDGEVSRITRDIFDGLSEIFEELTGRPEREEFANAVSIEMLDLFDAWSAKAYDKLPLHAELINSHRPYRNRR
ncbi:MAG: hypothetical protein AAF415_16240 [Pseudomonadota bacterium]